MKMNMVRLVGAKNVDFLLSDVDSSRPFVLKSAEGFGPPEITVQMAKTVLERGSYQGRSAALRQIVLLVGLQPDWNRGQTPEELRAILYPLVYPPGDQMVKVQIFHQGAQQAFAQGYISKLELALFTKDPAVQITIDCDSPYFLSPTSVKLAPVPYLKAGQLAFDVPNKGTAPSGFKMGLTLRNYVGSPLILSDTANNGGRIQLDGVSWEAGDRFVVDTRPGSRGVWHGPGGGALKSVLNNINPKTSSWLQLVNDVNVLSINTLAFDWDTDFAFSYQPAYLGV